MLPKTKGQTALEFIVMVGMIMVIGTVFLFSVLNIIQDTAERERIAALNDVAYVIQDEIILASSVEDGYERTIVVPQLAGRFVYELTSLSTAITLTSSRVKITYTIPEITGTISKGENTIKKTGTITVT